MEQKKLNVFEKLTAISSELKAGKNKRNDFGNFNYRSATDIYENLKPLLTKYNCSCYFEKTQPFDFNGDIYFETNLVFTDNESKEQIKTSEIVKTPQTKKGMDESQLSGSVLSYVRKYALGGLFLVDDSEDLDSMDNRNTVSSLKGKNVTQTKNSHVEEKVTPKKPMQKQMQYEEDF